MSFSCCTVHIYVPDFQHSYTFAVYILVVISLPGDTSVDSDCSNMQKPKLQKKEEVELMCFKARYMNIFPAEPMNQGDFSICYHVICIRPNRVSSVTNSSLNTTQGSAPQCMPGTFFCPMGSDSTLQASQISRKTCAFPRCHLTTEELIRYWPLSPTARATVRLRSTKESSTSLTLCTTLRLTRVLHSYVTLDSVLYTWM